MDYLVGDVQGCDEALERLLAEIAFSPSRDRLFVLGDLVNRGPASLRTLQRLRAFGNAATCLMGNHDLHLLAVAQGVRRPHRSDTFADVLESSARDGWLEWLRLRPLACRYDGWLMVHAGVAPQWDVAQTMSLAGEVQQQLAGPDAPALLSRMYGNEPERWHDGLQAHDRWRFVINALTRLRYCSADGRLLLDRKGLPGAHPQDELPWFDVPGRRTAGHPIACGHWSVLGLVNRPDLLAIDTGCVWGGSLTAVRIDEGRRDMLQVRCEQAQQPGVD